MPNLGMEGPFDFTSQQIDHFITKTSPGNYALGYTLDDRTFIVQYVGRSDTDLNGELKRRLDPGYKKFMYSYAKSPVAAYQKECHNYHDFGENVKLRNENHPDRPDGTLLVCPVCGQ
ncbi:hypothetical protein E3J62_03185 [candidate division TA06 bacterium]|uniref:GIY-YIG nuclease family protein n=1 Tax=candidate division TA06 bacterium TaxID=2250710 RepID=A0A523UW41_UNCT6|nr:MAG: hypothetical protein E3J62_03185 [candidate division TA06 bacterium]